MAAVRSDWSAVAGPAGQSSAAVPLDIDRQVAVWELQLTQARAEMEGLRRDGRWRSGRRTLLAMLGVQDSEVLLCRGLAWVLTPDGWHGLGSRMLVLLLERLGLAADEASRATVHLEEVRHETRADLIVRLPEATVLIEAKVFAAEQDQQADRLARRWAEDYPCLVFLTRDGRAPVTASRSGDEWQTLTWSEVGRLLSQAIADRSECAAGVRDFAETLRRYGS